MGVSEELGGYVTITVAVIVVTGVLGNILGELVCKIFRITEPISKGLALGSSAHAIGTAKAIELGEVEGAMGSLGDRGYRYYDGYFVFDICKFHVRVNWTFGIYVVILERYKLLELEKNVEKFR